MRLKIYSSLLVLVIALDALRFFVGHEPGIINWRSLVHAGWVTSAALFLLLWALTYKTWLGYLGLVVYGGVFIAALCNQFLSFSVTLNYHCMLFNLLLFTVYYFSVPEKKTLSDPSS